MSSRDDVLNRLRALTSTQNATRRSVPRDYRDHGDELPGSADAVARFVDRVEDYRATVRRTTHGNIAAALREILAADRSVVVPPSLAEEWRAACATDERAVLIDGTPAPLTASELDAVDAVVTGCQVAIAETGTIVLDAGPDQGRRVLTLLPDHHVVVVQADRVVSSVPEALAHLDPTRPLTFVSGPSATSDIEFDRVEGVHGPRRLDVLLVAD